MIKNVNDVIALAMLIVVIPALWILQALNKLALAPEVTGALIAGWTLILQYYFRKAPTNGGS